MTGLFFVLALAASAAAVILFLSSRILRQAAAAREAELVRTRQELDAARGSEKAARAEAKERRESAKQLEGDLASTKRRAFEQAELAKRAGGAATLRDEVEKLSHRLAEAREEATRASERAKASEAQLARAQAEVKALAEARKADAAAPPPTAPPVPVPPSDDVRLAEAAAALAEEKDRGDKAEARATELRKKLTEVERDLKAARGRIETEKRVYIVQKGELELANDRYAELRRRYDSLRKDHDDLIEAVRQAARDEMRGGGSGTPSA
ncbi:MAG: hypothetical protein ACJ79R_06585 [Anaeromyxobacteraceae bacterium]